MKHFPAVVAAVLIFLLPLGMEAGNAKIFRGFDGGMMLHTGYLYGNFSQIDYPVSGMPFGVGGVARIRLGNHFRIGGEGYVSTLSLSKNGSYSEYGWGGLLIDSYWSLGRFVPYFGLTFGGGSNSNLLLTEENQDDWQPLEKTYFNKRAFFALAPFVGCDYVLSETFHLTLKADWLNCIPASAGKIPSGPRLYFGFIFCH